MWLPVVIISLPGLYNGDTSDQLGQFFHQDISWSIDTINLVNEDVYINKHHSVFHTVILGSVYKLGYIIDSYTLGACIFTFMQVLLSIFVFAFMIKYMNKIKINSFIIILSIMFIGMNPIVITYSMCAVKDTPNALFNLLYVIFLLQIVRNFNSVYKNKLRLITFLLVIMLVLLLRNNGIYTFVLSFPLLFIIYRQYWKKLSITFLIPIILFGLYDKVLLPSFDVSNGSIREALSLPMMQISRLIRDKEEVLTNKDKEIINGVYKYDLIKGYYDPDLSDNIKDTFRKDTTKEELKLFFGVWFKYLWKEPVVYIESFVNSTYGYFFPEKNRDILELKRYSLWDDTFFNITSNEEHDDERKVVNYMYDFYYKMPFFMNNVAYYDWVLIISFIYIIKKKKYKYLIPLSPLIAVLLSCLASPVNGCMRYILPIVFSLPIIISVDYIVWKEDA